MMTSRSRRRHVAGGADRPAELADPWYPACPYGVGRRAGTPPFRPSSAYHTKASGLCRVGRTGGADDDVGNSRRRSRPRRGPPSTQPRPALLALGVPVYSRCSVPTRAIVDQGPPHPLSVTPVTPPPTPDYSA